MPNDKDNPFKEVLLECKEEDACPSCRIVKGNKSKPFGLCDSCAEDFYNDFINTRISELEAENKERERKIK
jgi:hypothetical protein